MSKRSPPSPYHLHTNKKYKSQHPRHSLHNELLNDTRSSDQEDQDDNLPPSAYFHKGNNARKRVIYGLLDDDEGDDLDEQINNTPRKLNFSDYENDFEDTDSPPQPSTSKSIYANAIPTQDLDDDIFSSTTTKRPVKGKKGASRASPEPDHMTYSL